MKSKKSAAKKTNKTKKKTASVTAKRSLSRTRLVIFVVIFGILGVLTLLFTRAATITLANIEAETLAAGAGISVVSDSAASGSKALQYSSGASAAGQFSVAQEATSITVRAKGEQCQGAPQVIMKIDGVQAQSASVSSSSWTDYTAPLKLAGGSHSISIAFSNPYTAYKGGSNKVKCKRTLYIDKAVIHGTVPDASLVEITVPSNGATVSAGVPVEAKPSGSTSVARVEFYLDGVLASTDTAAPYCMAAGTAAGVPCGNWDSTSVANGSHTITAYGYDANGNKSQPSTVTFTVNNTGSVGTAPSTGGLLSNVGVQFHCNWAKWSDAHRIATLDKMKAAGMKWVRIDVGWASMEPYRKGSYDFSLNDKCVKMATDRGFKVLETLWMTPGWANGGQSVYAPPTNTQDYADFAKVAAARYNGQNGVGKVDAWEVWNEPDPSQSFWSGTAGQYVSLVKAAYPGFKAGNPNAVVVVANPAANRTKYIDELYRLGMTGNDFDVIAVHPYMAPGNDLPPEAPNGNATDAYPAAFDSAGNCIKNCDWPGDGYITHTKSLRDLMVARGDSNKQIWWTEFGWSTCKNGKTGTWDSCVSESVQGEYFVRTLKMTAQNYPWVTNVFWFNSFDISTDSLNWNDNHGLLRHDLTPKASCSIIANYLAGTSCQ